MTRARLDLDAYVAGVRAADRAVLAQAITLVESRAAADQQLAQDLLARVLLPGGAGVAGAVRLGITGVPGVGKSTLIDALGARLCDAGKRVAVLAIDPSSAVSGGSILGDKTRMHRLAFHERAFVRPSPSGLTLGGVARRTRETLLLVEAAGFDVVIVETVGVGQSEHVVADMVDLFVVLMLPGAGDELQGIKKGVLELADVIAVNKADGDNLPRARAALRELIAAQKYAGRRGGGAAAGAAPQSLLVSALTGDGLDDLWKACADLHAALAASGELAERRRAQQLRWMWSIVEEGLGAAFRQHPAVAARLAAVEAEVRAGTLPPTAAARALLSLFGAAHED